MEARRLPVFIIFSFLFTALALFLLNSSHNCPSPTLEPPPSFSAALLHYATSPTTPLLTLAELSSIERALRRRSPANLLIFGLGNDSLLWATLNHRGRTAFLEEDESWIHHVATPLNLEAYHVAYHTKVRQADQLLKTGLEAEECRPAAEVEAGESKCVLALKKLLAKEVYEVEWDMIIVDGPTGFHDEAPGRMSPIYTAGLMAWHRRVGETEVFVHNVDRKEENNYSREFLCEEYKVGQEGKLGHFTIPAHTHRTRAGGGDTSFCPPLQSSEL